MRARARARARVLQIYMPILEPWTPTMAITIPHRQSLHTCSQEIPVPFVYLLYAYPHVPPYLDAISCAPHAMVQGYSSNPSPAMVQGYSSNLSPAMVQGYSSNPSPNLSTPNLTVLLTVALSPALPLVQLLTMHAAPTSGSGHGFRPLAS